MDDRTREPAPGVAPPAAPAVGSPPPAGPAPTGATPTGATPTGATPTGATPAGPPPVGPPPVELAPADAARPGPTTTDAPGHPRSRRPLLLGLAVLVVAAVVAAVVLGLSGRDGGRVAEPGTVVLPSPTPTVAPVARQPLTPFADSLPGSVLQYALASLAEHPPLLLAGAVEAYRLDYSDGAAGAVTVTAGQWPTPEEAAAALPALVAAAGTPPPDAEGPTSGEVLVGGAVAGTWTLTQAADGTGVVTWSNGTVVLQAVASTADVVRDVYAAYPY